MRIINIIESSKIAFKNVFKCGVLPFAIITQNSKTFDQNLSGNIPILYKKNNLMQNK